MVKNRRKKPKIVQNCPKWSQTQYGQKQSIWSKLVQIGQNHSKTVNMVKNGQNGQKKVKTFNTVKTVDTVKNGQKGSKTKMVIQLKNSNGELHQKLKF